MSARELLQMLSAPIFRAFVVPNLLRGLTVGITSTIAMFAVNMGYSEAEASRIPIMCALGCIVASLIYIALSAKIKITTIGLLGSFLLIPIAFLPANNIGIFLTLFFVAYMGRMVVDCVVPVMVIQIIDPKIVGAYNAWRNILIFLSSTLTVYFVGILLERGGAQFLLVACAAAYVISMIWYCVMYNKFRT